MQKSQRSISSFFTAKAAPNPKTAPALKSISAEATSKENGRHVPSDDLLPSEDDDELLQLDRLPKRSLDSDGVLTNEANEVSSKRVKLSSKPALERADIAGRKALQERPQPNEQLETPAQKPSRITERTSKYLFSSTQDKDPQEDGQDAEVIRTKERLHQRFVKKLGRPDSIAEIKRRNHFIEDAVPDGEDVAEDEEVETQPPSKSAGKGKKGVAAKKGTSKLTPLEKQVLEIKAKHTDTLLVVEVGYKCRFFGEDARTAAKELGIMCIPGKFRYDERRCMSKPRIVHD